MLDISHEAEVVERRVTSTQLDDGSGRVVAVSWTLPHGRSEAWSALTDLNRIPDWFLPVQGGSGVGQRYQLEGNAGGVVERCDPPNGFAVTWEYGEDVSWVALSLDDAGDGTRVTLEHTARAGGEHWTTYGPGATGVGWDLAMLGLASYLATGSAIGQEAGLEWMMSDDGKAFITRSSEAWGAASVAAGTDPDEAVAAARRTTAFYTGAEAAS